MAAQVWRAGGAGRPQTQGAGGAVEPGYVGMRLPGATHPNSVWCYDFVHDRFADGRAFRMLCVLDEHTHECLAIEVARVLQPSPAAQLPWQSNPSSSEARSA